MNYNYLYKQVSVFGQFQNINTGDLSKRLYDMLKGEMIPSMTKEFDIRAQRVNDRPGFTSVSGDMNMTIGSERIDIISGGNMLSHKDFLCKARNCLEKFFAVVGRIALFRLSFICDILLKTITEDDNNIAEKYINLTGIYGKKPLKGWTAGSVSEDMWSFDDINEPVNINITVSLNGLNQGVPDISEAVPIVKGLILHQDLNTSGENISPRFEAKDSYDFMNWADSKHTEILSSVAGGL